MREGDSIGPGGHAEGVGSPEGNERTLGMPTPTDDVISRIKTDWPRVKA